MEQNRRTKQLQVHANRRFANAKSSMLHPGNNPNAACRTYVHIPGRVLIFFSWMYVQYVPGMYERESPARHSSSSGTAKTMKVKPKCRKDKQINAPSHVKIICLIGLPCVGQKRENRTAKLLSQPCTPTATLAATSPPIRSG